MNEPDIEETKSNYSENNPQSVLEAENTHLDGDGDPDPEADHTSELADAADQSFENSNAVVTSEPHGLSDQDDEVNLFRDSLDDNLEPELN